jgi:hypothetical protein
MRTAKGRRLLELLYSAEFVRCWAMTHSLGLVCVPVPDDGLGHQCPSDASDLASRHYGLDYGSLPGGREMGEEDHGPDKFQELSLISGQIRMYCLQSLKLGARM